ncbi:MAG: class I mannose-6-phosphate isomerase [Tissierellia bacterium]|nr:class I mannose-6-phosphate isomerase [Tissierellia bacterium]
MFVLKSISKDRIWGTPRLIDYGATSDSVGSVYSFSSIDEINTIIENGVYKGKSIGSVIKTNPTLFGLKEGPYPLIISFTGADQPLSIQVHPTDDDAQKYSSYPYGKTESWYFLTEPSNHQIIGGSKKHLNKEQIKKLSKNGKYEEFVEYVEVRKNDLITIHAGTLHALTPGSLVYEIQQANDTTFRFYDYDRVDVHNKKRPLQLEEALRNLIINKSVVREDFSNYTYEGKEYSLRKIDIKDYVEYTNKNSIASIISVLFGRIIYRNITMEQGKSGLLLPNETITLKGKGSIMIATPKIYW